MAKDKSDIKTDEDLGQIREIIFGRQMRDYEQRFTKLHDNVTRTSGEVRTALESQLAELRGLFDSGSTETASRLDEVRTNIDQAQQQASAKFNDLDQAIDELRSDSSGALNKLRDELTTALVESEGRWTERAQQIDAEKVGRKRLSQLLMTLAQQLEAEAD